mmetsp:Transcript_61735/g.166561  ORF Transcript_61735/g.166561 Transcript_61735/m.166561 type:complete len:229 (-) Transcript_61735:248-934(-)
MSRRLPRQGVHGSCELYRHWAGLSGVRAQHPLKSQWHCRCWAERAFAFHPEDVAVALQHLERELLGELGVPQQLGQALMAEHCLAQLSLQQRAEHRLHLGNLQGALVLLFKQRAQALPQLLPRPDVLLVWVDVRRLAHAGVDLPFVLLGLEVRHQKAIAMAEETLALQRAAPHDAQHPAEAHIAKAGRLFLKPGGHHVVLVRGLLRLVPAAAPEAGRDLLPGALVERR